MAISNHERVGKALDLVKDGLHPFVEREMKSQHAQLWIEEARGAVSESQSHLFKKAGEPQWDAASLLAVMWNQWQLVFRKTLGQAERTLVSELRDVRNRWAHQNPFSSDDAYRALDSSHRLLLAVSAPRKRGRRCDGTHSRGVSVDVGSSPELAPSRCRMASGTTLRSRRARGTRQQEAAQRRTSRHRFRSDPAANGTRSSATVARGSRGVEAASR